MVNLYLRRKGNKYVIEYKEGKRTVYVMTLPPLIDIVRRWRLDAYERIASQNNGENNKKADESFALYPLTEPTEEEIIETLEEVEREDV